MNVQDRVAKAINGEATDSVPIFIPGCDDRFRELFNAGQEIHHGDTVCIVNGQDLTPLVRLGVDMCEVQGPLHVKIDLDLPVLDDSSLRVDMYGRVFKRRVSGNVEHVTYQGPFLRTMDQIEKWDHVVPIDVEPGWHELVYNETLDAVDKHAICPTFKACDGFYSILEGAIGVENMAILLHDHPGIIDDLLERIYRVVAADVDALIKARIAFIFITDGITIDSRPCITPDLVYKHLRPLYKKLVGKIHAAGGKALFRTRGDVLDVMDTLVAAGFDAVHVATPDPALIDEFLVTWGDKACAIGNFDVMSMLSQGTPVHVQKRAKEMVSSARQHGQRYIFGTNDVLPGSAKLENIEAMIGAVKQHGML
ncbi:MAG: hypothetical protein GYA24_22270 [Candidatus Lokiarchaeota archaeon]|nr:hypothetical protein [Candidatus Lokiarchaeota archaeon]